MKVLVEGVAYSITDLSKVIDNSKFYSQNGAMATINYVGYYHSFLTNELVYFLPKVFLNEGLVFGIYSPNDLLKEQVAKSFKHDEKYLWVRQLIIYFYKSLSIFRKRFNLTSIVETNSTFELNTNLGQLEYSYLDLVLSLTNFYRKNKDVILFHHIDHISNHAKKIKWEKVVRRGTPYLTSNNTPLYVELHNKRRSINTEEELVTYFMSIINFLNQEHALGLKIGSGYNLIEGRKFKSLQHRGVQKLRKIKYRYFSDTLKRMYLLCELYFNQTDKSSPRYRKEEFITVKNYNIVFEDMIDKLFSDKLDDTKNNENLTLNDLKYNKDGKIIDHIYEDKSLIDTSNIFYIGDSKYYKPGSQAGNISVFKQFTYSKNVIQFNVDLLNETNEYYNSNIRYRDEVTEGYNITPSFFLYGHIESLEDFSSPNLENYGLPKRSFHFRHRLFDRDTLFIQQYRINFLFVLRSYSSINIKEIEEFRRATKAVFRRQFIDFFNNVEESEFYFYEKEFSETELENFVYLNFKQLNGKCYKTSEGKLIVSKHINDKSIDGLLNGFELKTLNV